MNKLSIAFAVNDAYVEHLNIAIYSLLKNNKNSQFDIYVLCNRLSARSKTRIIKIQEYYKNVTIQIVELSEHQERFSGLKLNIEYISLETYYRYILPELFPGLNKLIYLDADIVITGDIGELYEYDLGSSYIAGVPDLYVASLEEEVDGKRIQYKETIGHSKNDAYINAGVLLMNLDTMRKHGIVEQLFKNTTLYAEKIQFQDQDIINITAKGHIKKLPNIFNYTDRDKLVDVKTPQELRIIHYTGPAKPWDNITFADFQVPFVELYRKYVDEYNKLIDGSTDMFALYTFSTENIGDDIQAVAARRFLPRIDRYINRDLVGEWRNVNQQEKVRLITNGWYSQYPYSWPIRDKTILPLYTSMYVEQSSSSVVEHFLSDESRDKFKQFGKIGARDESTLDFFRKNNIDAYLSGCLTLTLQRDANIKRQDFILLTDVSQKVYEFVKESTDRRVIYLTNASMTSHLSPEERLGIAEMYLYLYQSAHCVITERLHSTLPCLALETPTLLIRKANPVGGNKNRLSGLDTLVHCHSENEFIKGGVYDLEKPPLNPEDYRKFREALIEKCETFTGYNDAKSFAWSDIGQELPDEVLETLEMATTSNLKYATIEAMQSTQKNKDLQTALAQSRVQVENLQRELDRLTGLKASLKHFGDNLKRRIVVKIDRSGRGDL